MGTILPEGSITAATTEATDPAIALEKGTFKVGEYRLDGTRILRVDKDGELVDATPLKKDGTVDKPKAARIRAMVGVRDLLRDLRGAMLDPATPDKTITRQQKALKTAYDAFVKKHGELNKRVNKAAFELDPEVSNLLALEIVKARTVTSTRKDGRTTLRVVTEIIGLSDIFTKRTIQAPRVITHADTAQDALLASLGVQTRIDWRYMASITGDHTTTLARITALQNELAQAGRVFQTPDGSWQLARST